jgi:hypothetical protein
MQVATIDSMVWLPSEVISRGERLGLTHVPIDYISGAHEEPIPNFLCRRDQIGVPVSYGLQKLQTLQDIVVTDHRVKKPVTQDDPGRLTPRNPEQRLFWTQLVAHLAERGSVLAQAPTGFGKTVAAAYAISRLVTPGGSRNCAVVVVPTKALAEQWRSELVAKLQLEDEQVAVVSGWSARGYKCPFNDEGAKIAVCVINSLLDPTDFPSSFLRTVSFVIWDECHRLGAREFIRTVSLFPCFLRLALSATPTRKDGASKLIFQHFGEPSVVAVMPPMPAKVYTVEFNVPHKLASFGKAMGKRTPAVVTKLTQCRERNELIVSHFLKAYDKGRNILVLSDRIEHLVLLWEAVVSRGVEESDLGWVAGQKVVEGRRKPVKPEEIAEAKLKPCIFATYGAAKEGLDMPHLDFGIDATPRADGNQALGRIRRWAPNKRTPVWLTIKDVGIPVFIGYYWARLKDYKLSRAEIA